MLKELVIMTRLIELMLISWKVFVRKAFIQVLSWVCMFCADLATLSAKCSSLSASFWRDSVREEHWMRQLIFSLSPLPSVSFLSSFFNGVSLQYAKDIRLLWRCTTSLYAHYARRLAITAYTDYHAFYPLFLIISQGDGSSHLLSYDQEFA